MKKIKYLVAIIVIGILVFIGIEVFRKVEHEQEKTENNTNITTNTDETNMTNQITENTINEQNKLPESSTMQNTNTTKGEEIKDGQELIQKAEKTLTARGWAGASNNIVGIKDGILYYYNKGTGEFKKVAVGIKDIYYATELAEDITAKKGNDFEEIEEKPVFLVYE